MRVGVEEEQPRARRRLCPGRKLPAATRLRFDHPRAVAAGFVGGAVPRAAVGDQTSTAIPRSSSRATPGARLASVAPSAWAASRVGITMLRVGGTGRTMAVSPCSVNPAPVHNSETMLDLPAPGLQSDRQTGRCAGGWRRAVRRVTGA